MQRIEMLRPFGYCKGVEHAIELAYKARKEYLDKQIYIIGYLVHNKEVILSLEKLGIITLNISKDNYLEELNKIKEKSVIIFPAHGHEQYLENFFKEKDYILLDAVCPKVKSNSNIIKREIDNNHDIIYIGIRSHPETAAALSISKKVKLFELNKTFDYSSIKDDSPLVINQTTLNYFELKNIHEDILSKLPKARIENEICSMTRIRQEMIANLDEDVDMIIIVGDKASSNTNRLKEIANDKHPQATTQLVSNVGQLNKEEILNKNHIVISSGASTPSDIINMVYAEIVNFFAK